MTNAPRIPGDGEIAVLGLGRSGTAVTRLLRREGRAVYASDLADSPDSVRAAESMRAEGAAAETGTHDHGRIARADLVVTSPGIPPGARPIASAAAAGIPVVSEVEIALRFLGGNHFIAVTGTNGKSTTTAMIAHLMTATGVPTIAAGNIGTPLSEIALDPKRPQWIALEMSSFQLHDTPSIDPAVGVLTNLAPDHLDRYRSADDYYADKALLFQNASDDSVWIFNGDDPAVMAMGAGVPGTQLTFGRDPGSTACMRDGMLTVRGQPVLPREELPLLGEHNVANALAALLAVVAARDMVPSPDECRVLADGLRTFRGLPHRLETVAELDGVQWINDSKATNVSSMRVAVEGMRRPTVLMLGGRHKGEPYTSVIPAAEKIVRKVLAYGEAAELIDRDLGSSLDVEMLGSDFAVVVKRARAVAVSGDAVLLSPACSSFDMFENYEARGERFGELVRREQSA